MVQFCPTSVQISLFQSVATEATLETRAARVEMKSSKVLLPISQWLWRIESCSRVYHRQPWGMGCFTVGPSILPLGKVLKWASVVVGNLSHVFKARNRLEIGWFPVHGHEQQTFLKPTQSVAARLTWATVSWAVFEKKQTKKTILSHVRVLSFWKQVCLTRSIQPLQPTGNLWFFFEFVLLKPFTLRKLSP